MNEGEKKKISFFTKNFIKCPICATEFKREEMLTGGGRIIAGELTDELRRMYQPSKVYGKVIPLIYPVTVCPRCYYGVLKEDFDKIKSLNISKIKETTDKRLNTIKDIFGFLDFTTNRTLKHGAASYVLAIDSYSYFNKWVSPTVKKAICSLRAAWLFGDLEIEEPTKEYGDLQNFFYKKALEFYIETIDKSQKAEESFDGIAFLGPDTDNNFGYEGILYLIAALTLKFGYTEKDIPTRIKKYNEAKRCLSKMFGFGKASKEKPSPLLEKTREKYDELTAKIEELEEQIK